MKGITDNKSNLMLHTIPAILIILCFAVCLVNGFPDLPTSRNTETDAAHLIETMSFFPVIFFCCFSVVVSASVLYFGIAVHRYVPQDKDLSSACIAFGAFVLLAGIWVFTDSEVIILFAKHLKPAVLTSFIAFMLMPIMFIECMDILYRLRIFRILRRLFIANLSVFLIFVMLKAGTVFYLVSLAVHHVFIFFFVFYCFTNDIRRLIKKRKDPEKHTGIGMILFFMAVVVSMVMFLLGLSDIYSVTISIGLIALICSVFRLMLDKMIIYYKEQMRLDFYKNMAYTDGLTGLKNRNAFLNDQQTAEKSPELCYILFDINNLKHINDKYGHSTGDGVIRTAAKLIQQCFSDIGNCYRIGGDEFAVIGINRKEEEVKKASAKLEKLLKSKDSFPNTTEGVPGLAYGYAFRKDNRTSSDQLFKEADEAMYQRKNSQKSMSPPS